MLLRGRLRRWRSRPYGALICVVEVHSPLDHASDGGTAISLAAAPITAGGSSSTSGGGGGGGSRGEYWFQALER
jgi:hypothetical protein